MTGSISESIPINLAVEMMLLSPASWPSLRKPQLEEEQYKSFISAISPSSLANYLPRISHLVLCLREFARASPFTLSFVWMPLCNAVTSTKVLNEDPGCLLPCVARLNWLSLSKLSPPIIARTAPLSGSIAAIETVKNGSTPHLSRSTSSRASIAICWVAGLKVV